MAAKDCNETDVAAQVPSLGERELGGKGKRTIRQVITEGLWSYYLEGLGTRQWRRGREAYDDNAKAVA